MLHLLAAILCSASMALVLRCFRDPKGNRYGIILGNYLTCILLSALLTPRGSSVLRGDSSTLLLGGIAGAFFVAGLVMMQTAVRRCGAGLTAAFSRLGLLVSLGVSVLFFHETPSPLRLLGVGLVLAALVLIHGPKEEERRARRRFWLLLLTLLCCGGADAMAKVYEQLGVQSESTRYFFWLFLTALALTALLALLEWKRSGKKLLLKELSAGLLVGVPNYFSSYLLLRALQRLPAFLVYPVYSTGTILLVLLVGALLFRERLSRRQGLGVGLILAALVLLNL